VREEERRDVVGEAAVVLLWHRPVEAPQARLEVADRDLQLHCRERGCERRVDVAGDEDEIGPEVEEHALEPVEGLRRLLAVVPGADAELDVRLGQRKLVEEDVVDEAVVVLPRVDESLVDAARALQRGVDGRDLHVVRTRADHVRDERPLPPSRARESRQRRLSHPV
jgi:hypothetical protein